MASVSLCMIVKDEEEVLDRCLSCFGKLADEIIIVDTGSGDRTKEIAGNYTDRIYDFVWRNDFSAARNYGLEKASMEYCMWVDADDVMTGAAQEEFLEMKERISVDTDIIMMPYQTGFDEEDRPVFTYYRERIVRNTGAFRFAGKVHETIPLHGKVQYEEIPIEHRKIKAGDPGRNLNIYRKMEENGEEFDSRSLYYYGRELLTHGNFEKAARIFRAFLDRPDGWMENQIDAARLLARCLRETGREKEALEALFSSFRYDVPRGETCCDLGKYFLDRGGYEQSAFWYRQALLAKKAASSGAFVEEDCYGFLPAISLCVCFDRMGNQEEAERYNELAGRFKPESEYVRLNRQYFHERRKDGQKQNPDIY